MFAPTPALLARKMHEAGINMRYLGDVMMICKNDVYKNLILAEMTVSAPS